MRALFIGGCGRSGTTMLGDLVGVHPRHVCTPETSFKLQLVERWAWPHDLRQRKAALDWLARDPKFLELGIALPASADPSVGLRGLLESIVASYAAAVGKPSADIWIDHTPTNTRMGLALSEAFPDARLVHMVRDGRAIAASVMSLDWGPNDVLSAARFWVDYIAHGIALEQAMPDRVLRVPYEALVTNPGQWITRICEFAELEYIPEMLLGGGLVLPAANASQHALVGKPPDVSRLEAWRSKLDVREIEMFEAEVGELLPLLGYAAASAGMPRPASTVEELYLAARDRVLNSSVNRWRRRRRRELAGHRPRSPS